VKKEQEWCAELGLEPRFHIIQYVHMKKPEWWRDLNTEEALWDFYTKRVADVAQEFEGQFFKYDVMNEMIHWPYWFEKYDGAQYNMTNYFAFDWMRNPENGARVVRQAREYLPDAKPIMEN
jgi:GH35 family endo-1,4-beta-xylanase